ncbi:MAG TPA: response regulator [Polyangiaceae bacterium]|nr:response regulator [Polyangiaceae bacterium]
MTTKSNDSESDRSSDGHGPSELGPGKEPAERRQVRVLVVDDHEDSAELLLEFLAGRACEARAASDGTSALLLAQEFVPDVALLDIGLPDMDGYELGARLLQIPELRGLRMVALTGYSGHAEQVRAREAGFHAHVEKPVDIAKLFSLLDRLSPSLA